MPKVRSGVKGVVIQDGKLLTVKKRDERHGADYTLPGGGQEFGETLVEALQREFLEETGCSVRVMRYVVLREYIGKHHHGDSGIDPDTHVVDHWFLCELLDAHRLGQGAAPDEDCIGLEWLPVAELTEYRFFPQALIPYLSAIAAGEYVQTVYTGDVN